MVNSNALTFLIALRIPASARVPVARECSDWCFARPPERRKSTFASRWSAEAGKVSIALCGNPPFSADPAVHSLCFQRSAAESRVVRREFPAACWATPAIQNPRMPDEAISVPADGCEVFPLPLSPSRTLTNCFIQVALKLIDFDLQFADALGRTEQLTRLSCSGPRKRTPSDLGCRYFSNSLCLLRFLIVRSNRLRCAGDRSSLAICR